MKKVLNLLGIILIIVLIPYLIASLLEWNFIPLNWHYMTRIILGMLYIASIPIAVIGYLSENFS